MDNEKELRSELMAALSAAFTSWEHVPVRHAVFVSKVLVTDVIAVPLDPEYAGLTFAFEVKNPLAWSGPKAHLDVPHWTRAIHQAADYVYATLEPRPGFERLHGRRVSIAFVYPTTCVNRGIPGNNEAEYLNRIWGAFEAGVHSRVGKASWEKVGNRERGRLDLWLGADIWRSDKGFRTNAPGVLRGKRPLGSQQVDVLRELRGIDVWAEQSTGLSA